MTYDFFDAILEIYFYQTVDYDVIADQCGCTVLDVANTLNDYMAEAAVAKVTIQGGLK